jgi:hypothetical protein
MNRQMLADNACSEGSLIENCRKWSRFKRGQGVRSVNTLVPLWLRNDLDAKAVKLKY